MSFVPAGVTYARSKLAVAVGILDDGDASLKDRLVDASGRFITIAMDDLPPVLAAELVSLRHRLTWRQEGDPEDGLKATIEAMTDEEAELAARSIRELYVNILAVAPPDRDAPDRLDK